MIQKSLDVKVSYLFNTNFLKSAYFAKLFKELYN